MFFLPRSLTPWLPSLLGPTDIHTEALHLGFFLVLSQGIACFTDAEDLVLSVGASLSGKMQLPHGPTTHPLS